jgi:peptide/nickel transport system substrate-binding protein/oligopeptide transport system substrate-binding protein
MLAPIAGFADVHGETKTGNSAAKRTLRGLRAMDDHTVQITLSHADAAFVAVLAEPYTAPVSRAAVERDPDAFARQPVCVGPYRLATPWHSGDSTVTLVRSLHFRPSSVIYTRGGLGYADRVEFRVYPDPKAAVDAWAHGDVDVTDLPLDLAPTWSRRFRTSVVTAPGPYLEYVGLPTTTAPYDEAAVRQALSLALDRTSLAQTLYDGFRLPAPGFVPPVLGLSPAATACAAVPAHADVAAARATWDRVPTAVRSKPLVLAVNDDGSNVALARAVAQQWHNALGLVVNVRVVPWSGLIAGAQQQAPTTAFRFGWSARFPALDDYIAPLFTSEGIGSNNFSRFHDPSLDDLVLRQAPRAADPRDQAFDYEAALKKLCADMPLIPVVEGEGKALVATARVGSAVAPLVLGAPDAEPLLRELFVRSAAGR